ncbi:homoserine O-acetyltransferase, partial [Aliarcobacter butzleri]
MKIETKVEKFNEPLYLESGRLLESFELIYETYGELNK